LPAFVRFFGMAGSIGNDKKSCRPRLCDLLKDNAGDIRTIENEECDWCLVY
jgi:hypothetical protein